jgi:hypothetical protein
LISDKVIAESLGDAFMEGTNAKHKENVESLPKIVFKSRKGTEAEEKFKFITDFSITTQT